MSISECDVLILCGGLGTRLRSIDENTPKVMMEFEDRPFLDYLIEDLKHQGVERFVLCTGYKSDWVEEYFRKNDKGVVIDFSKEEQPLGTGGAIKNAEPIVHSDHFFVLNGDCFCDVNFQPLLDFQIKNNALSSIVASKVLESKDFGTLDIADDDKILAFLEKEDKGEALINAGRYCFKREVFDIMPEEEKFSLEYDVFPKIIDQQGLYGFKHEGEFFDIGTPERFQKAVEFFKERGVS